MFETGQIVHLRSGSPPMVVVRQRGDGIVEVEWHDGKGFCNYAVVAEALRPRRLPLWMT